MTKTSDLTDRVHKLIDDGGGRERYENDGKFQRKHVFFHKKQLIVQHPETCNSRFFLIRFFLCLFIFY